jgi:hypothetical protein
MSEGPRVASAAGPGADDDPSIPVLTDRIYLPAVELDMTLPAAPVPTSPEEAAVPADTDELETAEPIVPPIESVDGQRQASADGEGLADEGIAVVAATVGEAKSAEETSSAGAAPEPSPFTETQPESALHAEGPAAAEVVIAPEVQQPTAGDEQADASSAIEAPAAAPLAATDAIEAQAEAVRAAVLQRVAERLPEQVNAAVRDLMQPAIDQAMARLGEEAQVALRITLQDLVEQVLREELARRNIGEAPR